MAWKWQQTYLYYDTETKDRVNIHDVVVEDSVNCQETVANVFDASKIFFSNVEKIPFIHKDVNNFFIVWVKSSTTYSHLINNIQNGETVVSEKVVLCER